MVRGRHRGEREDDKRGDALFSRRVGESGLRGLARRTDSYGFVLVTLSALVWVFVPVAADRRWAGLVVVVVFYLAIVVSLHTSLVQPTTLAVGAGVSAALLGVAAVGIIIDEPAVRGVGDLGFSPVLVFTAAVILRRVLGHEVVTSRTIAGAVTVYLLLALAFTAAGTGLELLDQGSFSSTDGDPRTYRTMQYFSLVTIATLGYGDVLPVSPAARSLATLEAVVGQVYLVTIVARLVGWFGQRAIRPTDAGTGGGESTTAGP
jgi:hypothetical protein